MSEPLTKALEGNVMWAREFINMPGYHSTACVYAEVSKKDYYPVLSVADCFVTAKLWFGYDPSDQESMDNALQKADLIVDIVTRFRAGMAEAMAYHKEHPLPKRRSRRSRSDHMPRHR